jgi:adenosylcobyric acid synthase
VFGSEKLTRQRRGRALGRRVTGYEIHHGITTRGDGAEPWARLDDVYGDEDEGAGAIAGDSAGGGVVGTNLHGLFEEDGFRGSFLAEVAQRRGKEFVPAGVSFGAAREAQFHRLADLLEAHLDVDAVCALIEHAGDAERAGDSRS